MIFSHEPYRTLAYGGTTVRRLMPSIPSVSLSLQRHASVARRKTASKKIVVVVNILSCHH